MLRAEPSDRRSGSMGATAHKQIEDTQEVDSENRNSESEPENSSRAGARPRITLEFTPEAAERLRDIKEELDAPSNADVIRKALLLFDWILSLKRENSKVQVIDEDGRTTEMKF